MNLEDFKENIEISLRGISNYEIQEYHYYGYAFGSGIYVIRLAGYNFRFVYNGKDSMLSIEKSKRHEKYPNCNWIKIFEAKGLILTKEQLESILKSE